MGNTLDSCCKGGAVPDPAGDVNNVNVAAAANTGGDGEEKPKKPKKELKIRRTIQTEEIEMTPEEVAARTGDADPDFAKLRHDSAEREAAAAATAGDDAPLAPKRTKDRKGTAAPTRVPVVDEIESDDVTAETVTGGPQKRSKDRKGTGFVKAEMMPIEDDEDDEDEDDEKK